MTNPHNDSSVLRRAALASARNLAYDADGSVIGSQDTTECMTYQRMIGGPNHACVTYAFGMSEDQDSWLLDEVETSCG